jgi:hypothetical protein
MNVIVRERTVVEHCIVLPYVRYRRHSGNDNGSFTTWSEYPPVRGEVFISRQDLETLAEQGVWDSQFGQVLLLGPCEGLALEQAELAVLETKGGYHRSEKLLDLLKTIVWKEERTVPN